MARRTFQDGTVDLIVRLIDGDGSLIDPDILPNTSGPSGPISGITVAIYPPGFNPESSTTTVFDALYLAQIPTREELGIYSFGMQADPDTEAGTYYDQWTWTVDGVQQTYTFTFEIVGRTNLESYTPAYNNQIQIELDSTITSTSGETLGTDYSAHFLYVMTPMYASAQHLELEAGAYIQDVPDDTLLTEILLASREADILTFINSRENQGYFEYVRRRYTICRALFRLLGNINAHYMKRKRLADLDVSYGDGLEDKLNQVASCMMEFEAALNSGGTMTPDTSLAPQITVPGSLVTDRPTFGRGWQTGGARPIANGRDYPSSEHTRVRKGYLRNPRSGKNWTNTR